MRLLRTLYFSLFRRHSVVYLGISATFDKSNFSHVYLALPMAGPTIHQANNAHVGRIVIKVIMSFDDNHQMAGLGKANRWTFADVLQ